MPDADVEALTGQVARLAQAVQDEREAKVEANRRQKQSNRRMGTVLAVVVALAVAGWWNNNARIDQIISVRTGSRQVSCDDRAAFAMAHDYLVFGIVTRDFTRPVPPELAEGTERQLVPIPDCSTPEKVEDAVTGKTTPTKPEFPEVTIGGTQP